MKAEASNSKMSLVKRLADTHKADLKRVNFGAQRDAAFRWIAAAMYSIHESPSGDLNYSTYKALQSWLGAPEDPAGSWCGLL